MTRSLPGVSDFNASTLIHNYMESTDEPQTTSLQ